MRTGGPPPASASLVVREPSAGPDGPRLYGAGHATSDTPGNGTARQRAKALREPGPRDVTGRPREDADPHAVLPVPPGGPVARAGGTPVDVCGRGAS